MSCTVWLRNIGILFCHLVTGIRKSAINENKVPTENALLYRKSNIAYELEKTQNFALGLSYGNKKPYA